MERIKWPTINILFFLLLLIVLGTANLLQSDRPVVSEKENRTLASMPDFSWEALFSGEYSSGIDSFISDTFLFRENFLSLSRNLHALQGITAGKDDLTIVSFSGNNIDDSSNDRENANAAAEQFLAQAQERAAEQEKERRQAAWNTALSSSENRPQDETATSDNDEMTLSSSLLIIGNRIMEPFGYTKSKWEAYAGTVNRIDEKLAGNVRLISLIAPSSAAFYLDEKYSKYSSDQAAAIAHGYECMNEDILTISCYDTLAAHKNEYLYFRSDHHWTALGAYYAYICFLKEAYPDEQPVIPEELESGEAEGFLGYLNHVAPQSPLEDNPDTVYYWYPQVESTLTVYDDGYGTEGRQKPLLDPSCAGSYGSSNHYSIFLSGDHPFAKIESSLENGRVLLVSKDSYGNALVPWLVNHYQTIYVVDPRYFEGDLAQVCQDLAVDDLLIFNNVFSVGNAKWAAYIGDMFGLE